MVKEKNGRTFIFKQKKLASRKTIKCGDGLGSRVKANRGWKEEARTHKEAERRKANRRAKEIADWIGSNPRI